MKTFFHAHFLAFRLIFFLSLGCLAACGGGSAPVSMPVNSGIFIGEVEPTSVSLIFNPVEENAAGTVTTVITEEFDNRYLMEVAELQAGAEFPDFGPVNIVLNPNLVSTATVYKLNVENNQPFGTHQMNLNLILETPDQNLTLDGVLLMSDTARLELAEDLPTLTFFFQGQPKAIDIASFEVLIPSFLVSSTEDPN